MRQAGAEDVRHVACRRGAAAAAMALSVIVFVIAVSAQAPEAPKVVEHQWTMAELLPAMADLGTGRDWLKGGQVFEQAGCGLCHALGTYWEGNGLAPDLTSVASNFTRGNILQSILEPSTALNGQYYHTEFTLDDGTIVSGSVVGARDGNLVVAPVMMAPDVTIEIPRTAITSERPSPVSPMPAGLLNLFTREQILDLIAFLDAGGNAEAAIYRQ